MKGILYGISTGPGDPELMTLKAVRAVDSSGVIAVGRTSGENTMALDIVNQVCNLQGKEVLYLDFPMCHDIELTKANHCQMADLIEKYLSKGKNVSYVCLGDISIYSTFSYIADEIINRGYNVQVLPGVTSFCASAARLKLSLGKGSEPIVILPGSCEKLSEFLKLSPNAVIMKCKRNYDDVINEIKSENYSDIYAVSNCGLKDEKVYNLNITADNTPGYFKTIIALKRK